MTGTIRALIVDDEPAAREGLRFLLEDDAEVEVIGECADGREAVMAILALAPDLVFLDVQMPEMDGFAVIEEVGAEQMPVVIFVTAYDQYALGAFDVQALDYLLKPFDDERFVRALRRAKDRLREGKVDELGRKLVRLLEQYAEAARGPGAAASEVGDQGEPAPKHLERLSVKKGDRVIVLKVEEIDWIEAKGDYVRLHTGRRSHLVRDTMKRLEEQLDPSRFVRTHRSMIVNLDRIKELHPYFHGDYIVVLDDGTELKLSRSRRQHMESRLGRPL